MKRFGILATAALIVLACGDSRDPVGSGSVALSKPSAAKNGTTWEVPGDFATLQDAVDDAAVQDGDRILMGPGEHAGALLSKRLEIKGTGGATIASGPLHPAGLLQGIRLVSGSDGSTISHLTFTTDLSVHNGDAIDDVTVAHCTFLDCIQGVSNWRGSGWNIHHNTFVDLRTRNGGGIAILVADYSGGIVRDNVVSQNRISGTVHVSPTDGGGYNASGIVIYADFRWGRDGSMGIFDNRIVHNSVALTSDTPDVVDAVGLELTDTMDDPSATPVIFDNAVGFNDLRGSSIQLDLTPDNLDAVNALSRNLGKNRGHGLHPSVFR